MTHCWIPVPDNEDVQASTNAVHMQSLRYWNVSNKEESLGNSVMICFSEKKETKTGERQRYCYHTKMLE